MDTIYNFVLDGRDTHNDHGVYINGVLTATLGKDCACVKPQRFSNQEETQQAFYDAYGAAFWSNVL